MKKYPFLIGFCLILFLILPGFGQTNQIGLVAGLNLGNVDISPSPGDEVDLGYRTGFAFGGCLYFAFSPTFGLQVEPTYMQKGSKVTIKEDNDRLEGTLKANYIDIPALLKISLSQGNTQPYVMAGVDVAIKLGDANLVYDKIVIDGMDVTSLVPENEREEELPTKSTDFGVNFGAGIQFPIGNNQLFVEGQYNIGLVNVADEPGDDDVVEVKTKGIQIKVGILFPLGK